MELSHAVIFGVVILAIAFFAMANCKGLASVMNNSVYNTQMAATSASYRGFQGSGYR